MSEPIVWELVCSNGTCIKLRDVQFEQSVVDVADCDMPGLFVRVQTGPVRISAIIDGTEVPEK